MGGLLQEHGRDILVFRAGKHTQNQGCPYMLHCLLSLGQATDDVVFIEQLAPHLKLTDLLCCAETGDAQALLASKKLSKKVSLVRKVKDTDTAAMPGQYVYIYCRSYEVSPAAFAWLHNLTKLLLGHPVMHSWQAVQHCAVAIACMQSMDMILCQAAGRGGLAATSAGLVWLVLQDATAFWPSTSDSLKGDYPSGPRIPYCRLPRLPSSCLGICYAVATQGSAAAARRSSARP